MQNCHAATRGQPWGSTEGERGDFKAISDVLGQGYPRTGELTKGWSFLFPGNFVTGKGPFLSQESLQLGKDSSILGKVATGKGPFLSQERTTLQLGKDSSILESSKRGKERKAFRSPKSLSSINWNLE